MVEEGAFRLALLTQAARRQLCITFPSQSTTSLAGRKEARQISFRDVDLPVVHNDDSEVRCCTGKEDFSVRRAVGRLAPIHGGIVHSSSSLDIQRHSLQHIQRNDQRNELSQAVMAASQLESGARQGITTLLIAVTFALNSQLLNDDCLLQYQHDRALWLTEVQQCMDAFTLLQSDHL